MSHLPVHSMTGFCSLHQEIPSARVRIEMKSVNHRFLDLKLRLPREWNMLEVQARQFLQSRFQRGALDIRIEKESTDASVVDLPQIQISVAAHYFEQLQELNKTLGLTHRPELKDLLSLPEVIQKKANEGLSADSLSQWPVLQKLLEAGAQELLRMRAHEGSALVGVLSSAVSDIDTTTQRLRGLREKLADREKQGTEKKIRAVFEAHPLADAAAARILESRIAQELALILERGDIEEELARLAGHCAHFQSLLSEGGPLGRKLEFLIQEMHREINTLGSKSQDLGMSQEVIQLKVRIEQLREQVMNIE